MIAERPTNVNSVAKLPLRCFYRYNDQEYSSTLLLSFSEYTTEFMHSGAIPTIQHNSKIKKAIFTNGINKPASALPAPPADLNELCNKK